MFQNPQCHLFTSFISHAHVQRDANTEGSDIVHDEGLTMGIDPVCKLLHPSPNLSPIRNHTENAFKTPSAGCDPMAPKTAEISPQSWYKKPVGQCLRKLTLKVVPNYWGGSSGSSKAQQGIPGVVLLPAMPGKRFWRISHLRLEAKRQILNALATSRAERERQEDSERGCVTRKGTKAHSEKMPGP
jgi:hypothetical protein